MNSLNLIPTLFIFFFYLKYICLPNALWVLRTWAWILDKREILEQTPNLFWMFKEIKVWSNSSKCNFSFFSFPFSFLIFSSFFLPPSVTPTPDWSRMMKWLLFRSKSRTSWCWGRCRAAARPPWAAARRVIGGECPLRLALPRPFPCQPSLPSLRLARSPCLPVPPSLPFFSASPAF